jgi:hypothetical protein
MQKRAEDLREQVRTIIKNTNEMPTMINLIIMLERLALDYHYENEINQLLNTVFSSDYDDNNLHLVSLRFYLLRKYGYIMCHRVSFSTDTTKLAVLFNFEMENDKYPPLLNLQMYFKSFNKKKICLQQLV